MRSPWRHLARGAALHGCAGQATRDDFEDVLLLPISLGGTRGAKDPPGVAGPDLDPRRGASRLPSGPRRGRGCPLVRFRAPCDNLPLGQSHRAHGTEPPLHPQDVRLETP